MSELGTLTGRAFERFDTQTALVTPAGDKVSYAELHALTGELANIFVEHGARPGMRISICLPKSPLSVAAILATTRCGAAYLPLDPDAPASRNQYIIQNAGSSLVVTTPSLVEALIAELGLDSRIDLTVAGQEIVLLLPPERDVADLPDDLAYILYTSGSTGQPKGVMITHANATCFVQWAVDRLNIHSSDILSSIAPFHFDLSVFDLYAGLSTGATVVLIDPAAVKNPMLLAELIPRFRITVWYATPTTLKMMLRFGRMDKHDHTSLRTVLFAGEVFPIEPLNELRRRWHHARFFNLYGPTETNVCTYYAVPETIDNDRLAPFPIGIPCPYATCYIEDEQGIHPMVPGQEGELLVGGQSVMPGYLNLPDRNARALAMHQGERCYRTGDLVRVAEDHNLIYKGRKDRMVKRNGYRIELGEVEAALNRHPDISEAGVIDLTAGPDQTETRIIGFFATRDPDMQLSVPDLQVFLQRYIPTYMLPDQFRQVSRMPMTSTHKVDYPALQTQA